MISNVLLNIQDGSKWIKFFKSTYVLFIFFLIYSPWLFIVFLSFLSLSSKGNVVSALTTNFDYGSGYYDFFFEPAYYGNFWLGFFNSLMIALFVMPISLFIGLVSVIAIWKTYGQNKRGVFLMSNLSIGTPDIIQGIAFFILFLMCFLPLGISFGFFTIVFSHISFSVPYVIIFLYPKMSKINQNILYASYDLKYGQTESIFKVIVPMMFPNLFAASLIVFSLSFDDFIITNLVRGNVTTLTSELYTMKKGIKGWAITFGGIIFWLSIFSAIVLTAFKSLKKPK